MAQILVVDSEKTVRRVTTMILERAGHIVRPTGTFEEALSVLRNSSPIDLVITNVFLSGTISAHDAVAAFMTEFPGLRVLMVSGLPDEKIIDKWIDEVGFDVFPKPFTSDSLVDKVSQMLAEAHLPAPRGRSSSSSV